MFTTKQGPLEIFTAAKSNFTRILGKRGKAFAERVEETFERVLLRIHERRTTILTSGRYTPDGQRKELHALLRPAIDEFKQKRAEIAKNLNEAIASKRADVRAITTETSDPNQQIIRQPRIARLDAHLRTLDKLELGLRMRLALEDPTSTATALFADTLREAEIIGLPIVDRAVMSKFLIDLQDRAIPEIAEIAEFRDALDAMAEQAIGQVRAIAEHDRIDLSRDVATAS